MIQPTTRSLSLSPSLSLSRAHGQASLNHRANACSCSLRQATKPLTLKNHRKGRKYKFDNKCFLLFSGEPTPGLPDGANIFEPKNPDLGKFWKALEWNIFYGFWNI
jgi:hypothetical protein